MAIPTLGEAGNLPTLLERLTSTLDPLHLAFELIVVDDDSRDGTEQIVQAAAQHDPRIRLLVRKGVRGLAGAVTYGWQHSDAAILGVMDADLQHPPELLPDLWRAIQMGADLAIASRYAPRGNRPNWNRFRHLISHLAIWTTWPLQRTGIRVHDPMSGFFLVRREVITGLDLQPQGFKILLEILVRGNVHAVKEVPFTFGHREAGRSKAGLRVGLQYLALLVRLWKRRSVAH